MLPDLPPSESLYSSDQATVEAIARQVEKDFGSYHLEIAFDAHGGTPYEALFAQILPHVKSLLNSSVEELMQLLYRIDVSEKQVANLSQLAPEKPHAEVLTELIIEREWKKVLFRQRYR